MTKLILAIILFTFNIAQAQQTILTFKKRHTAVHNFWKGSTIAFQLKNLQWKKGEITWITNDSFYIRPMVVKYSLMGTDTFHYAVEGYPVADVHALPKKGVLIDYIDGRFQISTSGGRVNFTG